MTLPEYFHLATNKNQKAEWVPVRAQDVPAETGIPAVYLLLATNRSATAFGSSI